MARRLALLTAALLVATLFGHSQARAESTSCTQLQVNAGTCNVSGGLGDGEAVLDGSIGIPGSSGQGGSGSGDGGSADPKTRCVHILNGRCLSPTWGHADPAPDAVAPVTLNDIASFRPSSGVDSMEPAGWTIVGLHTNFFASRATQVVDGQLLGKPASVRFTPVQWTWDYGDGSSATFGTPGASWAATGTREFDPTDTSHVYTAVGTYGVAMTTDVVADYSFDGQAWVEIDGTLAVPANTLSVSVNEARTVLVAQECSRNPTGPGC